MRTAIHSNSKSRAFLSENRHVSCAANVPIFAKEAAYFKLRWPTASGSATATEHDNSDVPTSQRQGERSADAVARFPRCGENRRGPVNARSGCLR